ncbi:hypothetical protein BJ166DRAFT_68464 [Pestalotiopsis sp. NC0098]|nr:hypothetical protein BJ166DRAFT_68464 [Pestalotiopsis sp. NC0098]
MNECPSEYLGEGSCSNPFKGNEFATSAMEFFQPCQGAAYTFPNDHQSNVNGNPDCQANGVICCIGSSCQPHQRQCTGDLLGTEPCAGFR